MGFDLSKDSLFDLSKEAPSLEVAGVGLGWKTTADLDVSAFCVGEDGHIPEMTDFVYFKSSLKTLLEGEDGPRPYSTDGGVYGAIDELEGVPDDDDDDDDGDVEDMWIYFDRISENIKKIVVVVSIYNKGITLKDIPGCYCRIWDQTSGNELCRYTLSDDFGSEDAVEIGEFVRTGSGWSFKALGNGKEGGLGAFVRKYAYRF